MARDERRSAQRYDKDVPAGRMAALLGQLKTKLDKGVKLARLEFLIASADNPRDCQSGNINLPAQLGLGAIREKDV